MLKSCSLKLSHSREKDKKSVVKAHGKRERKNTDIYELCDVFSLSASAAAAGNVYTAVRELCVARKSALLRQWRQERLYSTELYIYTSKTEPIYTPIDTADALESCCG